MVTYTFNEEKFLVILSGSPNDLELIRRIEVEINVANRRHSTYPSKFFPRLIKDHPSMTLDLNGNITLQVQCPNSEGLDEVSGLLRKKFSVTPAVEEDHFVIIDKPAVLSNRPLKRKLIVASPE